MTKRTVIQVPGIPESPSPIANAVVVNNTCYISGQLAVYEDGYRAGPVREEAARSLELLLLVAEVSGFSSSDIVFVDVALADLDDLPIVDTVWAEIFPTPPARTIYEVSRLPFGAKVKIQAIAARAG